MTATTPAATIFPISPFYYYGVEHDAPETVQRLAHRIIDACGSIRGARLAFHAENPDFYGSGFALWHLVILDVHTGYEADILDYSNAATIRERWADADILDLAGGGMRTMLALPLDDDTEARLFPIEPDDDEAATAAELLAEISDALDAADHFADYPVLDESDYSEREYAAWNESLDDEIRYAGIDTDTDDAQRIAAYVSEHYYGYSDPGYVDTAWITEAIRELRITVED